MCLCFAVLHERANEGRELIWSEGTVCELELLQEINQSSAQYSAPDVGHCDFKAKSFGILMRLFELYQEPAFTHAHTLADVVTLNTRSQCRYQPPKDIHTWPTNKSASETFMSTTPVLMCCPLSCNCDLWMCQGPNTHSRF